MYYVYIIKSLSDGTLYIGSSEDIQKRLEYHNRGASRYTRKHRPWQIVYFEDYSVKKDALVREKYLKSLKSREALKYLIRNHRLPWG